MPHPDKTIQKLLKMAIKHYEEALHADLYATTAAFAFSRAEAGACSTESATEAALVAASESAAAIVFFTHHLATLNRSKTTVRHALKNYRVNVNTHAEDPPSSLPTEPCLKTVTEVQDGVMPNHHAYERYHATFDTRESEQHQLALMAACAHYTHVYASARSAYVHAIKVAAPYPTDSSRRAAFTHAFEMRLSADLTDDPIHPGFFMAMLCSDTVNIMCYVVLAVGLLALSLGLIGLGMVSVSAVIASIGLNAIALTVAGSAMTAVSAGLLTCRFFTQQQWQRDNETSRQAIERFNDSSTCHVRPSSD